MNLKYVLTLLLLCAVALSRMVAGEQSTLTIAISAERFSFSPNEITVKKGEEVKLVIKSKDVSHGLVIQDLGVRTEVKKGQASEVKFTAESAGTYEGRCAHFCGKGHGSMIFRVHVTE